MNGLQSGYKLWIEGGKTYILYTYMTTTMMMIAFVERYSSLSSRLTTLLSDVIYNTWQFVAGSGTLKAGCHDRLSKMNEDENCFLVCLLLFAYFHL